jgi:two-component system, NtrC family, sensor histidine kinase HydH
MSDENVMNELIRYVGFDSADAARLVRLGPLLAPSFDGIVDEFYAAIERHPQARAVFKEGHAQIERQKARLREWLQGIFGGVYDDAYFERRARIGRVHVQIDLDQRYMFGAMNIVRAGLHRALLATELTPEEKVLGQLSIDRICDIELAIMLETYRERYVERQRASARLATIGQVAASIGHELRNPLAVMESSVHLLRRRVNDEKSAKHFDKIAKQISISSSIINGLLALARDRPPQREPVRIDELIAEAIGLVHGLDRVSIDLALEPGLAPLALDRGQMRQVFVNLIGNAAQSIDGDRGEGRIEIAAGSGEGRIWIEIRDDGPGFKQEVLERAFEPLVTSRTTGIGLGLALCARIVERHGGSVEAKNRPERGAIVRVLLPTEVPQ